MVRTCNQTVRFSKFIFNKNIKEVWRVFLQISLKRNFFPHREREIEELGFINFFFLKKRAIPRPIRERRSVTIPFQPIWLVWTYHTFTENGLILSLYIRKWLHDTKFLSKLIWKNILQTSFIYFYWIWILKI